MTDPDHLDFAASLSVDRDFAVVIQIGNKKFSWDAKAFRPDIRKIFTAKGSKVSGQVRLEKTNITSQPVYVPRRIRVKNTEYINIR
jgi:hypothetical protein